MSTCPTTSLSSTTSEASTSTTEMSIICTTHSRVLYTNECYKPHSPTTTGVKNPPKLAPVFHSPQYVPRSLLANQRVSMDAEAGAPRPWTWQTLNRMQIKCSEQKVPGHGTHTHTCNTCIQSCAATVPFVRKGRTEG